MNWKNVLLIFAREVRDQIRDRRTLFMIIVLPLILYPAMGIGMFQMTTMFREQARNVVVLGVKDLPQNENLSLFENNRFRKKYFKIASDANKLLIVPDNDLDRATSEEHKMIEAAKEIRDKMKKQPERMRKEELEKFNRNISRLLNDNNIQVILVIPEGFSKQLSELTERVKSGKHSTDRPEEYSRPIMIYNNADEKSKIAYQRIREVLGQWEKKILEYRMKLADLPEQVARPVDLELLDVAAKTQLSANFWSKLFPALLVIMAVTGAFYPAVDLAAGEKERGTMETLLICPASRTEIVIGKFFTVMAFSMSTAILNLLSMGMTGKIMFSMVGAQTMNSAMGLEPPSMIAMLWVGVIMIPLAALFSALCLALATFARSSKEGQYYLTPLLMVTMGATVFCLSPAIEIEPFYSVLPIVGATLLLKELLASAGSHEALLYVIPVLATSIGYSAIALWWAIEQFRNENILFREAERFNLKVWMKHLVKNKERTPTFAEGVVCFVVIMFAQFAAMKVFASSLAGATTAERPLIMTKLLMIQQLAFIAAPALIMGIILTSHFRSTFRVKMPRVRDLGIAFALALFIHPLTLELGTFLSKNFFPKLPESIAEQLAAMSNPHQSIFLILAAFALAPAICEELAFRGFILSGFSSNGRLGIAIILSSMAFGIFHIIPQQVFNAALLGFVLGLITIRSNSLFPAMLFHFTNNTLAILHGRWSASKFLVSDYPVLDFFLLQKDGSIRYDWPLLVVSGILTFFLLRLLIRDKSKESEQTWPTPQLQKAT